MDFISSKAITKERYNVLLRDAKPIEYNKLKAIIKAKCKKLYNMLCLDYPNPYGDNSKETPKYYVLAHSMSEYFIKK